MPERQKVTTCLWFASEAEEAARFYVSLLEGSRILGVTRYGKAGPGPEGSVLTVAFDLAGREFMALNGGEEVPFNHAVSLVVRCDDQAEIDRLWDTLIEDGGRAVQCGWLQDRFGLSWQIVPAALEGMLGSDDAERTQRVMEALHRMVKLDLAALERAYDNSSQP